MASFSISRTSCSAIARKVLSAAYNAPKIRTRKYARLSRLGRNGGEVDDPNMAPSSQSSIGTFLPMPTGGLSHPLFEPNHHELVVEKFEPDSITENAVGQAMAFGMNDNEPFRKFGLPRNLLLEFRLLSKPCSVIRDVTLTAVDVMDAASIMSSRDSRFVLTGEPGTGKSFTLLQALQYCSSRNWIVMYIPRAVTLVNSSTQYIYDPRTRTYLQPVIAYRLLQRFLTVNHAALLNLTTNHDLQLDKKSTVLAGTPLTELIDVGLNDHSIAPTILSTLLSELEEQTSYPVLLAIDDFNALYCKSTYRDPQFHRIKSYHLSVPRLLLEYASGKKSFTRGAVLGAISTAQNDFPIPLELREALDLPHPVPNSPYLKRSPDIQTYTEGLRKLEMPQRLSVNEAAGIFEVWMKDRALHSATNDELFLAKYTESSGNPRDFVWRGLLGTLES